MSAAITDSDKAYISRTKCDLHGVNPQVCVVITVAISDESIQNIGESDLVLDKCPAGVRLGCRVFGAIAIAPGIYGGSASP
jgi:hypothetical protein